MNAFVPPTVRAIYAAQTWLEVAESMLLCPGPERAGLLKRIQEANRNLGFLGAEITRLDAPNGKDAAHEG